MTDEQFLAMLANRRYDGLADLELAARREAIQHPEEFPAFFQMRSFLIDAINHGLIRVSDGYRLEIACFESTSAD